MTKWSKGSRGKLRLARGFCRVCGCRSYIDTVDDLALCSLCCESLEKSVARSQDRVLAVEQWLSSSLSKLSTPQGVWEASNRQAENKNRTSRDREVRKQNQLWTQHLLDRYGSIETHAIDKTKIVDDQTAMARRELRRLLTLHNNARANGQSATATEAIKAFRRLQRSIKNSAASGVNAKEIPAL